MVASLVLSGNLLANAGDMGLWVKRSPGKGNSYSLQDSCLGNPIAEEPGGLLSLGLKRIRHMT